MKEKKKFKVKVIVINKSKKDGEKNNMYMWGQRIRKRYVDRVDN